MPDHRLHSGRLTAQPSQAAVPGSPAGRTAPTITPDRPPLAVGTQSSVRICAITADGKCRRPAQVPAIRHLPLRHPGFRALADHAALQLREQPTMCTYARPIAEPVSMLPRMVTSAHSSSTERFIRA